MNTAEGVIGTAEGYHQLKDAISTSECARNMTSSPEGYDQYSSGFYSLDRGFSLL